MGNKIIAKFRIKKFEEIYFINNYIPSDSRTNRDIVRGSSIDRKADVAASGTNQRSYDPY